MINAMTTTNYYDNADPTSGLTAQSDKLLNVGNANPLAGDVLFPTSDPLLGASSFYPTSFAAAPQYNQDSPTAGPVENLFEGVLPGANTESVETNPDVSSIFLRKRCHKLIWCTKFIVYYFIFDLIIIPLFYQF